MKNYALLFLCSSLLFFTSCTLSDQQEMRLNNSLAKYIDAYNENNTLYLAGYTEPEILKHYKSISDSAFLLHFKQTDPTNRTKYDNPIYREMKVEGKSIQCKYWVELYSETEELNDRYCIFALSSDGGNNWFFASEEDYFDKNIEIKNKLFRKH